MRLSLIILVLIIAFLCFFLSEKYTQSSKEIELIEAQINYKDSIIDLLTYDIDMRDSLLKIAYSKTRKINKENINIKYVQITDSILLLPSSDKLELLRSIY